MLEAEGAPSNNMLNTGLQASEQDSFSMIAKLREACIRWYVHTSCGVRRQQLECYRANSTDCSLPVGVCSGELRTHRTGFTRPVSSRDSSRMKLMDLGLVASDSM